MYELCQYEYKNIFFSTEIETVTKIKTVTT